MKKQDIYLPHIHYILKVRPFKQAPEEIENALAYVTHDDRNTCTLYIDFKRKPMGGDLAHELVHVLQFICLDRNMKFELEHEHYAYIMHYLFGKIMGYSWK